MLKIFIKCIPNLLRNYIPYIDIYLAANYIISILIDCYKSLKIPVCKFLLFFYTIWLLIF